MSVNKAIIVGNLGADPEVRTTNSGTSVANLRVATSYRDETEWHNVVVFGKQAENAGRYLKKGSQAYFEGRIQTRKWTNKDGEDRYSTEVVANNVRFLSGGGGNAESDDDLDF